MLTKLKNLFTKEDKPDQITETTESVSEENKKEIDSEEHNILNKETIVNSDDSVSDKKVNSENEKSDENKSRHSTEEIKEEVIKVLKTCYDPEIPVDVWELGLIYDIKVATNGDVMIIMTLTSPSCPVAGILPGEIEQKVREHPMVNESKVELTFDPPWSQNNMSEVAKLELGFL